MCVMLLLFPLGLEVPALRYERMLVDDVTYPIDTVTVTESPHIFFYKFICRDRDSLNRLPLLLCDHLWAAVVRVSLMCLLRAWCVARDGV
ncbi:hypothetical protein F4677DRAFT_418905 [Hypoxylon crocopeplum]|nr:hypothetical protein F4677DRAFT_418905 [Hypoxylon crocopeplum]